MSLVPYVVTAIRSDDDGTRKNIVPFVLCTILNEIGTPATVFSTKAGTPLANPFLLDYKGQREIWLEPGIYSQSVAGSEIIEFNVSPTESDIDEKLSLIVAGERPVGAWDADTNTPTLTNSSGNVGDVYYVSVAGDTDLNGETDWDEGTEAVKGELGWFKRERSITQAQLSAKVTGPESSADDQVALFDGVTGKLLKAGQTLTQIFNGWLVQLYSIFPRTVATYADIASQPLAVGQVIKTRGHSIEGVGANEFVGISSSAAPDGGTLSATATSGVRAKMLDTETIKVVDFGVVGSGDETVAIQRCEASSYPSFDLCGLTVKTTLSPTATTKKYYNGTLLYQKDFINHNRVATRAEDMDITSGTKSHVLEWKGKNLLWLGTSIPADGGLGTYVYGQQRTMDAYPFLFAEALAANVKNFAWASSHAYFDKNANAFTGIAVNALSMTEDDRQAMLALYGPTSDYSDSSSGATITKPSQMTADFRIKAQFAAGPVDIVILDHNHNDRLQEPGTLAPPSSVITGITKGATTQITLASLGTIAVGDSVLLSDNVGIFKLNYAAARVQSIAGSTITLNIDSSGYAGTFTSGTVAKVDKSTIYGAWEFLISYIKNMSYVYGDGGVKIILAGAPSEYTGNTPDPFIYSIARYIKKVSDKWGLSFFDIANEMKIQQQDHIYYLPDATHPTTYATRAAIAAYWVRWASGGAVLNKPENAYLPAGRPTFIEQGQSVYSRFFGGFDTPDYYIANPVALFTENFAGTLASWTVTGPATPTIVTAPWSGGGNALRVPITSGNISGYISRAAAFQEGASILFDFQISTINISPNQFGVCNMLVLAHPNTGSVYVINLVKGPSGVTMQVEAYTGLSSTGLVVTSLAYPIAANTKYKIKLEGVRGTANTPGSILLYVNDQQIGTPFRIADSAQTNSTHIYFGAPIFNNTAGSFDLYYGNITVSSIDTESTATRYTGTIGTTPNAMKFVNGILISVS